MTLHDNEPTVRCGHRLWDDIDGVRCTRAPHGPHGHTYISRDGSACPDRHTTTEPTGE